MASDDDLQSLTLLERHALLEEIYTQLAQFSIPHPTELSDLPDEVLAAPEFGMYDPAPVLPQFTGVHPDKWLAYAERYFTYYRIHDTDRFPYVLNYFHKEAAMWLRFYQYTDWSAFIVSLVHKFGYSPHALQVFDNISDRIATKTIGAVHETIDDEIMEIQTDSMVDVHGPLGVTDIQMELSDSFFGLVHVKPCLNFVLADDLKENHMVENNIYDIDSCADSIVNHSFAWKPGLIANHVQVSPWKFIIPAVSTLNFQFGSSAMVIARCHSPFVGKLQATDLGFVTKPPTVTVVYAKHNTIGTFGFDPGPNVVFTSYSTHIIRITYQFGVVGLSVQPNRVGKELILVDEELLSDMTESVVHDATTTHFNHSDQVYNSHMLDRFIKTPPHKPPTNIAVIRAPHDNTGIFGKFLVGSCSHFGVVWLGENFSFDPGPIIVKAPSSIPITSMFIPATSSLESCNSFLYHGPTFVALDMSYFAFSDPKLFVLDKNSDPPDQCTSTSIQLHFYRDVDMLEPIWKCWKTYIVEIILLQGADNWLFNSYSLVITYFEWKPGWPNSSVVHSRRIICFTKHYFCYYICAIGVIATERLGMKNASFLLKFLMHINPKHPPGWIVAANEIQHKGLNVQSSTTSFSINASKLIYFMKVAKHIGFTYSARIFIRWGLTTHELYIFVVSWVLASQSAAHINQFIVINLLNMHVKCDAIGKASKVFTIPQLFLKLNHQAILLFAARSGLKPPPEPPPSCTHTRYVVLPSTSAPVPFRSSLFLQFIVRIPVHLVSELPSFAHLFEYMGKYTNGIMENGVINDFLFILVATVRQETTGLFGFDESSSICGSTKQESYRIKASLGGASFSINHGSVCATDWIVPSTTDYKLC